MKSFITGLLFSIVSCTTLMVAQDTERPLPPALDLVTVDPLTGHTSLYWTAGGSPDVAAYVIYLYLNEEGYAIDTLFQPYATTYTNTSSNAAFFSESYVIAAIDSSDNVSPLSNFLNTIFITGNIDTCGYSIELTWNAYISGEHTVDEYVIYSSQDGSTYAVDGSSYTTSYSKESFDTYSEYCFYIEARLSNGTSSYSNSICLNTDLPSPPEWINANYATCNAEGSVSLSFSVDPGGEYNRYIIERSTDISQGFVNIHESYYPGALIDYTDHDPPEGIVYYRLAALNSCGVSIIHSNTASIMNISLISEDHLIRLRWNGYYEWRGGVSSYRVFRNIRGSYEEIGQLMGNDTTYTDDFRSFMYETGSEEVCYRIEAEEGYNPYFEDASSISNTECIEQPVNLFVPNAFTPDDNNVNDLFMPVMSFTPVRYRMIIKNRAGITLFQTESYHEGWDGRHGGSKLPEDIYIWFIEAETPGGKTITRTGTLTIIFNQEP